MVFLCVLCVSAVKNGVKMFRTAIAMLHEAALNNRAGMWAWLVQRLTGLALALYLIPHLIVLASAQRGAAAFDRLTVGIQTPIWHVFDIALLGAFLMHGFNGLRVIAVDTGARGRRQKAWLLAMAVIAGALFLWGSAILVRQIFAGS